ncbi:unnamed protein product, partial [Ectocarpus sp. 12 AP-2014]
RAQEGNIDIAARVVFPVIYHILEQGAVSTRRAVPTLEKTGVWLTKLAFFVGARTLGLDHRSESPTCCLWDCTRGAVRKRIPAAAAGIQSSPLSTAGVAWLQRAFSASDSATSRKIRPGKARLLAREHGAAK